MELGILGPLEVRDGPAPVRVPGAKERALLADLLVNAGRVVSAARPGGGPGGAGPRGPGRVGRPAGRGPVGPGPAGQPGQPPPGAGVGAAPGPGAGRVGPGG